MPCAALKAFAEGCPALNGSGAFEAARSKNSEEAPLYLSIALGCGKISKIAAA